MNIEIKRAMSPGEQAEEETCGICGLLFEPEVIQAWVTDEGGAPSAPACPTCLKWLGRRAVEEDDAPINVFTTIEEYEEALRRYPEPMFASDEEAERADKEDPAAYRATWNASWITDAMLTDEKSEPSNTPHKVGVMVTEMMRKRGIDGVEELTRRMNEFPEHRTRDANVATVTAFMETGDVAASPAFFRALGAVLKPSDNEYRRLLWAHFADGQPLPESLRT